MRYQKTKKELLNAIQWTGTNLDEIKQFVPKQLLRIVQDPITQLNSIEIIDPNRKILFKSKWGDYVTCNLDETRYEIINKEKFESEFTPEETLIQTNKDTQLQENEKIYLQISLVKAQETTDKYGREGYNVTDNTGFVKFIPKEEFENTYSELAKYSGKLKELL